jgi:hypothetical protein
VDWPAAASGLLTQPQAQLRAREGVTARGKSNSSYDADFFSYYVTYCAKNISGTKKLQFSMEDSNRGSLIIAKKIRCLVYCTYKHILVFFCFNNLINFNI